MRLFKKRIEISKALYTFIKISKKSLLLVVIGKIALIGMSLLVPVFNKILIDEVLLKQQMFFLKWLVVGYVLVYFIETAIMYIMRRHENKLYYKTSLFIKDRLWRIQLYTPISSLEKQEVGEQKNRLDNDVLCVENFLSEQMINSFVEALTTLCVILLLLKMNSLLCLFGIVVIPISFKMTNYFGTKVAHAVEGYRGAWGSYEGWLSEYLTRWKEVKALNLGPQGSIKFIRHWKVLCKANFNKWLNWFANSNFVIVKDTFLVNLSIYFVGALLIFNGQLTVGSLLVFKVYYEKMIESLNKISALDINLYTQLPGIERVLEMMNVLPVKTGEKLKDIQGSIQIKDVSYSYEGSNYVAIKNVSLNIVQGEHLAIVGPSGCGKSTLVKLLLGIYQPDTGMIWINKQPLERLNLRSYYSYVGTVNQDFTLFNMSIVDNLRLAAPQAEEQEMRAACEAAHIWEEIANLPEGIHTKIGEGGEKLSVGQRQRLCLARIILKQPSLIILDEATSALDGESERFINEVLMHLDPKITVIVIAHRLASVEAMRRVVVLEDGKIVGDGTPDELSKYHLTYQRIFAQTSVS